jgi:Raf kinase inhibitor-like YbhB/YbcL family protein
MLFKKSKGLLLSMILCAAACANGPAKEEKTMALNLSSKSFASGENIPKQYTCDAEDRSPELHWAAPPAATKSFALIADDPDAPVGTWVHWVLFNLPADTRSLPESLPKTAAVESGAVQGQNDFGKTGYNGPCPPPGKPHRYFFKLYALDLTVNLKSNAKKPDLERAMKGHILAQGEYMGRYAR